MSRLQSAISVVSAEGAQHETRRPGGFPSALIGEPNSGGGTTWSMHFGERQQAEDIEDIRPAAHSGSTSAVPAASVAATPLESRSLDRARRILGLTVTVAAVIVLAAPLGVRSAQPSDGRTARLVEAVEAPRPNADRGSLATRSSGLIRGDSVAAHVAYESLEPRRLPGSVTPTAQIRTTRRAPAVVNGNVWDALAQCESSGNWSINTGNGYYGGLQFNYSTWLAYGGGEYAEYAHLATREQQIEIAERLRATRGFYPWPACAAKLGLI